MQSNEINELAEALVEAQKLFPTIKKTHKASIPIKSGGSYSYDYADIGDVNDAVNPILREKGLVVIQEPTVHVSGLPSLTTTLLHRSGQWKSSEMLLQIDVGVGAQAQGSAITYARRYAKSAMLDLVTESDDDGAGATHTQTHNAAVDTETGEVDPRVNIILEGAKIGSNEFVNDLAKKWNQYHKLSENQLDKGSSAAAKILSNETRIPARVPNQSSDRFALHEDEERF